MAPTDRRLAALHNNLSILLSETGDLAGAHEQLATALGILEASSVDPEGDLDIAATLTNLSLVCHDLGRADEAARHAARSTEIFRDGGHEHDAHFGAALAGQAEASFRMGRLGEAVRLYSEAIGIVEASYGRGSDAYAVTAENLALAEAALAQQGGSDATGPGGVSLDTGEVPLAAAAASATHEPGLARARRLWEGVGKPMLEERYPELRGRVAAGLVGHGSECYGFDDALSQDHDFAGGFCLWLEAEDYLAWGARLQADYEALVAPHLDAASIATARASGAARRTGVFEVGDFFAGITGLRDAPAADAPHEWMTLDEATLAAATNGAVFADPLGAFSAVRGRFLRMPDDVRLARLGQRLGMMAQAGQYNVPRMLSRGDGPAAWLAVGEFVRASASAVFLLNRPQAVGYLPYYKWHLAALRALAARPATRLPGVHARLEDVMRLASAACFGGAGFGEGGKGSAPARAALEEAIERACAEVAAELRVQRLSDSDEPFLEAQRARVQARIKDQWLREL